MAGGGRNAKLAGLARVALAGFFLLRLAQAAGAASTLPPDKIKDAVAQRYGVEVLRVTPAEFAGAPAYAVVVMYPGGDYNTAFQVSTLLVDAATGEPIAQFRHRTTGYALPEAAERSPPDDDSGATIRRLTSRGR